MKAHGKAHHVSRIGGSAKEALQCRTNPPQRILVVEDEPDIRQLETEVLRESGYDVDTAENGLAALHSLNTDHYDLLIVEEEMSMVTGLELVKELRSEDMMVPVILVVGTMPIKAPTRNQWPHIQAILLKPYTIAELFKTVKEVLRVAGSGAYFRFAPPSNWQSPTFSRWFADLKI
jgi:DNA-binding response OmpR family regulator